MSLNGTGGCRIAIALLVVALAFPNVPFVLAADDTQSVGREIESILSEQDYQQDWPATPPADPSAGQSEWVAPPPTEEQFRFSWNHELDLAKFGEIAKVIGIVLLAIIAIFAIVQIVRRIRPTGPRERPAADETPEAVPVPRSALEEIERLAQAGRLDEAIHLLLLRFIDDIRERTRTALQPALTSREILTGTSLPDDARARLADVVTSVEHSHFGGQPVSREAFERCLAGYRAFTTAGGV
jgi:hypothetical protein